MLPCMSNGEYLRLRNVSKRYGGVQALRGIDLDIAHGEVHGLVGENGSGKSTLIKIISGVTRPDPGATIAIEGVEFPHLVPAEATRRGVQVIFQDLALFPSLSVAENIAIGAYKGIIPRLVRGRALHRTALAGMQRIGVGLDPDERVENLSIANRQIVAICRALAADARFVIMDEPTASLTRNEVTSLLRVAADMQRRGISILFVSHRLGEVMAIAKRVTVLRDGQKVGSYDPQELDHNRLAFLMTGQEFHVRVQSRPSGRGAPVLQVRGLSKRHAYADIGFEVAAGEIVGITGLLGSGRTRLALTLFGMHAPDSGAILLDGSPIRLKTNRDAIESGIAYVSEDRLTLGLIMPQSITSNIIVTFMAKLADWAGAMSRQRRGASVAEWIGKLAIKAPDPERAVRTLSGGNQQRVVLAKWLARRPKLLILDSPTVGVDIAAKSGIYEIVRGLAEDGVAVILISDEVAEVLYNAHRILVMGRGRIIGEYLPEQTSEAELDRVMNA
jgi:simple sugar transport system ATP-binding protein